MHSQEFFNSLDYIYIGIMFVSSVFGLIKGFSRDFLGTCSWFLSGFLSVFVAPALYSSMRKYITNVMMLRGACLLLAFLGLLFIFLIITHLISARVKNSVLAGVDRSFGMLFGLLRGMGIVFFVCVLMWIFEVRPENHEFINKSQITSIIFNNSDSVISYLEKTKLIPKNLIKKKTFPKSSCGYNSVVQLAPRIRQKQASKDEDVSLQEQLVGAIKQGANMIKDAVPMEDDREAD